MTQIYHIKLLDLLYARNICRSIFLEKNTKTPKLSKDHKQEEIQLAYVTCKKHSKSFVNQEIIIIVILDIYFKLNILSEVTNSKIVLYSILARFY